MLYAQDLLAWLEPALALLIGLLTICFPGWLALPAAGCARLGRRLAGRSRSMLVGSFLIGFLGCAGVAAFIGLPAPRVSDEHSYLLAADLFAHGRAAAAVPPSPAHFETFFVLVEPSYASKYPPAQGLSLAIGQVLTGRPAASLWLLAGLLCAATFWALRAWLSVPWSLVGATVVAARLVVAGYWGHSFWGGSVAAFGGALLWGAAARIALGRDTPRLRHGILLGFAAAILANSRPLEGLLVSVPAAFWLAGWAWHQLRSRHVGPVLRVTLPATAVMAVALAAMAAYNQQVTGSPWQMPYSAWEERYATVPNLSGQPLRHIEASRPEEIVAFYQQIAATYDPSARWIGARAAADRLLRNGVFFWGAALALPACLSLGFGLLQGGLRWAGSAVMCLALAQLIVRPWWPHYTAPATVLLMLFAVLGLRALWSFTVVRKGRVVPAGQSLVVAILIVQGLMMGPQLVERAREQRSWGHVRTRMVEDLRGRPGNDVIFVRYGAAHHPAREWVFNRADLAAAPVLWARDLGAQANRRLLTAFEGRHAWLLHIDLPGQERPFLEPYPLPPLTAP